MGEVVLGNGGGGWNAHALSVMRISNVFEGAIRMALAHDGHATRGKSRNAGLVDVDAGEGKISNDVVEEDE